MHKKKEQIVYDLTNNIIELAVGSYITVRTSECGPGISAVVRTTCQVLLSRVDKAVLIADPINHTDISLFRLQQIHLINLACKWDTKNVYNKLAKQKIDNYIPFSKYKTNLQHQ